MTAELEDSKLKIEKLLETQTALTSKSNEHILTLQELQKELTEVIGS
jgi:hypothetical protein